MNSQADSTVAVPYLLGVDGGGSGTRARLVAAQAPAGAPPLGQGEAGPSNLSRGVEAAWAQVQAAARAALTAAGLADLPFSACALGAGLAGAHVTTLRQAFIARQPTGTQGFAALAVDHDGQTALLGAHGGGHGVVLIAGTGSAAEAAWPDGRQRSAGGWGFGVGDEGSGAWLGLQAVRHTLRTLDGQHSPGPLARAVLAATVQLPLPAQAPTDLCSPAVLAAVDAMRHWLSEANQGRFAALAPQVFHLAEADPVAAALLTRAAQDLAALVQGLDPAGELPLACAGSIAQRLVGRWPADLQARCVAPVGDAMDGALHLIRRQLRLRPGA